jgi:hypothetical protein
MPDLWTREEVDEAKATADVSDDKTRAIFDQGTSPANGLQAAKELLGDDVEFSHFAGNYPVYTTG